MDGLKAVPKTPEGVAASLPPSETPPIISVPGVEVARPLQVDAAIARLEEISRQMEAKGLLKDGKLLDKWEIEVNLPFFTVPGFLGSKNTERVIFHPDCPFPEKWKMSFPCGSLSEGSSKNWIAVQLQKLMNAHSHPK